MERTQRKIVGEVENLWDDTAIDDDSGPYTGVIVVHGIGDEKRNDMLQETLNALTYWYNHVAGLALRPRGTGRVWVHTHLTDDNDPDSPASRALIELVPPARPGAAPQDEPPPLHLKLREVWWAQSFGTPAPRSAMRWARLQFLQEATRIMLPLGGKVRAWRRARATPPVRRAGAGARLMRGLLHVLLAIYDFLQYCFKSVQWVLGIPLVYLLLVVLALVQALSPIPGFKYLLGRISAIIDYISLHWIASMQVYLLDYTRSASIRHRFDREVRAFLRDPNCQRITVIAHSMGTVVAYEGLTNALSGPTAKANLKPIAFICLAQALKRIWLLARTDPHRMCGVLPANVRWLHFWARFDPVASGSLTARALPRFRSWRDPMLPDPTPQLQAMLRQCENIEVVNEDSILSDHSTYWNNLEEIVGPIAAELVTGHPELERIVAKAQATDDDVLRRRWRVAWRASVSLLGGLALGVGAFYLGVRYGIGPAIRGLVAGWFAGGLGLPAFLGDLWKLAAAQLMLLGGTIHQGLLSLLGGGGASTLARGTVWVLDLLITLAAALIVMTIGVQFLKKLFALPPPFVFYGAHDRERASLLGPHDDSAPPSGGVVVATPGTPPDGGGTPGQPGGAAATQ
ncbi:MAG TPA: hypothetical protein VGN32_14670 [Ktedonobacterales bacterium]|nr:hypothetical protein [Ktedonobacterales bacterium]